MGKKGFVVVALDSEYEIFIVHIASLSTTFLSSISLNANIHPFCRPQIADLIAKEAFIKVSNKYVKFVDVFSLDLVFKLFEHIGINNYTVKLVDGYQPSYGLIYNQEPVELETLKTYIKTNLANKFIRLSKSTADAPILFDQKSDRFFRLCVDYRGLNNLIIKNWYSLPLVGELLDRLGRARQFTQLKFISAYYRMRICKEDKWKTAFRTWYSHFENQVISFGLTNVLASF